MTYVVARPVVCTLTDLDTGDETYEVDGENWIGDISIPHGTGHSEMADALVKAGYVDAGVTLDIQVFGFDIWVYRDEDGYPLLVLSGDQRRGA